MLISTYRVSASFNHNPDNGVCEGVNKRDALEVVLKEFADLA